MLKKMLRSFGIGAAFAVGIMATVVFAGAATGLSTLTTANGSFPADFADINLFVNAFNAAVGNYLSFGQTGEVGSMYLPNAASFAANGSVATSVTSLGPTGSHTTIQEWLIVYDNNGTERWIPMY